MKKKELLKMLENVGDDVNLFFVSKEYDCEDDMSWDGENLVEVVEMKENCGDVFLVMNCGRFVR